LRFEKAASLHALRLLTLLVIAGLVGVLAPAISLRRARCFN
jgi:hypothetical protein